MSCSGTCFLCKGFYIYKELKTETFGFPCDLCKRVICKNCSNKSAMDVRVVQMKNYATFFVQIEGKMCSSSPLDDVFKYRHLRHNCHKLMYLGFIWLVPYLHALWLPILSVTIADNQSVGSYQRGTYAKIALNTDIVQPPLSHRQGRYHEFRGTIIRGNLRQWDSVRQFSLLFFVV